VIFTDTITQAMQNPPLTNVEQKPEGDPPLTPEEAWKKRQKEAKERRGGSKRGSSSGGKKISDLPSRIRDLARKFDANRDGKIDRQEWAKLGPALRNMARSGSNGSTNSGTNGGSSGSNSGGTDTNDGPNSGTNGGSSGSNSGGTDTNDGPKGGGGGLTGNPSQLIIQAAVLEYQIENGNLPSSLQQLVDGGYVLDANNNILTELPPAPGESEWVLNEDGSVTFR